LLWRVVLLLLKVKALTKLRLPVILLMLSLTGCSMLTARGRAQRKYQNYVRKSTMIRYSKPRLAKMPMLPLRRQTPSEPKETISTAQGPQSVSTSSDNP
jgi:hypothetical protein